MLMKDRPNTNQTNALSMKVLKGPKQIEREKTESIWDRFRKLQSSLAPLRKGKQIKRGVYRIRGTSIERS
jgi:ribosomal protein L19E